MVVNGVDTNIIPFEGQIIVVVLLFLNVVVCFCFLFSRVPKLFAFMLFFNFYYNSG